MKSSSTIFFFPFQCDTIQDGMLEFDRFYNGFMAPYFGCYRCTDTKKAFAALDMDKDGLADWEEFKLFLIYALEEHPDRIAELEDLLNIAFIKGIFTVLLKWFWVENHITVGFSAVLSSIGV